MNDLHNALHCGIPEVVLGAVHDSEQQTTLGTTPEVYAVNIGHAVSPLAKSWLRHENHVMPGFRFLSQYQYINQ